MLNVYVGYLIVIPMKSSHQCFPEHLLKGTVVTHSKFPCKHDDNAFKELIVDW